VPGGAGVDVEDPVVAGVGIVMIALADDAPEEVQRRAEQRRGAATAPRRKVGKPPPLVGRRVVDPCVRRARPRVVAEEAADEEDAPAIGCMAGVGDLLGDRSNGIPRVGRGVITLDPRRRLGGIVVEATEDVDAAADDRALRLVDGERRRPGEPPGGVAAVVSVCRRRTARRCCDDRGEEQRLLQGRATNWPRKARALGVSSR
jgi:hypothetical protein